MTDTRAAGGGETRPRPERIASFSRSGPRDLAITFVAPNGETATLYVDIEKARGGDRRRMLGDELACTICCSGKAGFLACMARCVSGDGKCCDGGTSNCEDA